MPVILQCYRRTGPACWAVPRASAVGEPAGLRPYPIGGILGRVHLRKQSRIWIETGLLDTHRESEVPAESTITVHGGIGQPFDKQRGEANARSARARRRALAEVRVPGACAYCVSGVFDRPGTGPRTSSGNAHAAQARADDGRLREPSYFRFASSSAFKSANGEYVAPGLPLLAPGPAAFASSCRWCSLSWQ